MQKEPGTNRARGARAKGDESRQREEWTARSSLSDYSSGGLSTLGGAPALEDPALRARWRAALRRRADQEAASLQGPGQPQTGPLGKHAADHLRVLAEGRTPLAESESLGDGLALASARRCDAVLIKRQPGCKDQGTPQTRP